MYVYLNRKQNHKTQEHTVQTTSAGCLFQNGVLCQLWFDSTARDSVSSPMSLCFSMTQRIDCIECVFFFFSVVLKSSHRTCYFLKSLRIEPGPFPNRSKSTSTSSMGRRNAVSLSTLSTLLREVFMNKPDWYLLVFLHRNLWTMRKSDWWGHQFPPRDNHLRQGWECEEIFSLVLR